MPADEPFLRDMLYHAIYVPSGRPPPDRDIVHRPELAKYVENWGCPDDSGFLALEPAGNRPIGAAWLRLLTAANPGYGYVDDATAELSIAVLPEYRGQGVGTRLLTHLLAAAATRYAAISLSVAAENPAFRLYQRCGFETVGQCGTSLTMRKVLARPQKIPQIFVTNDDGIHSPGLRAAVQAVRPFGDVLIVAPATQQTGMGRGFAGNSNAPLTPVDYHVDGQQLRAFACEGSPAFAVQHGLNVCFADKPPDLLISGINYGENLGTNITMSGTVGAAIEAACRGIPALAVSLQTVKGAYYHYSDQDWAAAAYFLAYFARSILTRPLPFDVDVLKVDVPSAATPQTPWRVTRLSRRSYYTTDLEQPSLASMPGEARLHVNAAQTALEPDSDIHALAVAQVVSVTPLSLDCTSRTDFPAFYELLRRS